MIEWEYKGEYCNRYEQNRRAHVTNIFCWAYRGGNYAERPDPLPAKDLTEMLDRVREYCEDRLRNPHQGDFEYLRDVIASLGEEETKAFCRFIAKRERLSADQKAKLKGEMQQQYANKAMQTKPPSQKQLDYLRSLGCVKTPANAHEASVLIDDLVKRKKAA